VSLPQSKIKIQKSNQRRFVVGMGSCARDPPTHPNWSHTSCSSYPLNQKSKIKIQKCFCGIPHAPLLPEPAIAAPAQGESPALVSTNRAWLDEK
jgi:hypothetical protein